MPNQLVLEKYLPYQLAVAAKSISLKFSEKYCLQFDISVSEWRVLAAVGEQAKLSAEEVCDKTTMEKVAVSRAVAKLLDKSMLVRKFSEQDRRRSELSLSEQGMSVYQQIIPAALQFQKSLLDDFSEAEIELLEKVLSKLSRKM